MFRHSFTVNTAGLWRSAAMETVIRGNKRAGAASLFGMGLIGFGLGSILSSYFFQVALIIFGLGTVMYAWGMYTTKHRDKDNSLVWKASYWMCRGLLLIIFAYTL